MSGSLGSGDVEIADDVYLIVKERAEEYLAKKATSQAAAGGTQPSTASQTSSTSGTATSSSQGANTSVVRDVSLTATTAGSSEPPPGTEIAGFHWSGEISSQKWMNFYTKVLSRFATSGGLRLTVSGAA